MSIRETSWKVFVILFILGILGGIIGAALLGPFLGKPGPQGAQGPQGQTGNQGLQGVQGVPGKNGNNSILQSFQNANSTVINVRSLTDLQWFNMSDFDPMMKMTINLQQNSKIYAQFSSTNNMSAPEVIWLRIVVDHNLNSSSHEIAPGPPASSNFVTPGHIEFLTGQLSAGLHTVEVQFQKQYNSGTNEVSDRIFTVFEITSP